MESHLIYCSACDRQVRVAFVGPVEPLAGAGSELDPTGICLDYCRGTCTGSLCALFNQPPSEMLERLREMGPEN
jgi:hypothetical protein